VSVVEKLCESEREVIEELEVQTELSRGVVFPEAKDRCNNPHQRAIERLKALLIFIQSGVNWDHSYNGLINVYPPKGGTIVYSLRKGVWKYQGNKNWRASIKPENFIRRYVFGNEQ